MKKFLAAFKIPLSFILAVLLPIILIGGFIYGNDKSHAIKMAENSTQTQLSHVVDVIRYEYGTVISQLKTSRQSAPSIAEIASDDERYLRHVDEIMRFDADGLYYSPLFLEEKVPYQIVVVNEEGIKRSFLINLSDMIQRAGEKTDYNLEIFSPTYTLLYNPQNPELIGKRILNDLTNLILAGEPGSFDFEGHLNQFTVCFLSERECFVNLSTPMNSVLADYKKSLLFIIFAGGFSLIVCAYFVWKSLQWQDEYAASKTFENKVNRGLMINKEIRRLLDETLDDVEPLSQITHYLNRLENDLKRIRDEMDQ